MHRDIKPENISFGLHLNEKDFEFDEGFEFVQETNNGKANTLYQNNNLNDFETVSGNQCFKLIDFGLSFDLLEDNRDILEAKLMEKGTYDITLETNVHPTKLKEIKGLIRKKMLQEIIHNEECEINDSLKADSILQKLFAGTYVFFPPEYYSILIRLIRLFPDLLNPGNATRNICKTLLEGEPYSEDKIIEKFINNMKRFGSAYTESDFNTAPQIILELADTENFEYCFFRSSELNGSMSKPFVLQTDIYSLGLSLIMLFDRFSIFKPALKEIIKELYNVNVIERSKIDLLEISERIRNI